MELIALLEMARRRWWLIVLPTIVVLVLSLPALPNVIKPGSTYSVGIRFTAAASAEVVTDANSSYEDSAYVPWLASEYVVVNLPQWVTSDSFAREVSAALAQTGLTIPYEDIRGALVADSARSVMIIYINWDDPEEIKQIAETAITVLQTKNQDYFPQFAAHPAEVEALDDVRVNTVAPGLMTRFSPLLRLVIGFAAGIALAVLAEYLDNTVRKHDDLQALGLSVLSTIPKE